MSQRDLQAAARRIAGSVGQVVEDVHAALDEMGIAAGQFGERIAELTGIGAGGSLAYLLGLSEEELFFLLSSRSIYGIKKEDGGFLQKEDGFVLLLEH